MKLLGFSQHGDNTWWIRQEDQVISLNIRNSKKKASETIHFSANKNEYESAIWLGKTSILLKKKFSKGTERMVLENEEVAIVDSNISVADMDRIQSFNETLYINNDGVVQILDEDLEINDQIMLKDDHAIISFAPISAKQAYVLEDDGKHLHIMEMDKTGIYRSDQRIEIPYTLSLLHDPILGLVLIDSNYINLPREGSSPELLVTSHLDTNQEANREYEKKVIANLFTIDIDGDGTDEAAAVDYINHTITVYGLKEKAFKEMISWKVFDDDKYPYGQQNNTPANTNPYRMFALDLDGDSKQDLVLASHDRLIIYLAEDKLK